VGRRPGASALGHEERDEVGELLLGELLPVVLGHEVGREALGHLGIRIDDRLMDELGVTALERLVEVRPDVRRRPRVRDCVAGAAAGGEEDLPARLRVAFGRSRLAVLARLLGRRRDRPLYGLGEGRDGLAAAAGGQESRDREGESEAAHRSASIPRWTAR
jgi:hypothetical protein